MSNGDGNNLRTCADGIEISNCTVFVQNVGNSGQSIPISELKKNFDNIIKNIYLIFSKGPSSNVKIGLSPDTIERIMRSLLYYGGADKFDYNTSGGATNSYNLINLNNPNNLFARWNSRNAVNVNGQEIQPLTDIFNTFESSPYLKSDPNTNAILYYRAFNPYLYYIIYEFFYNSTPYKLNGQPSDILLQNINNIGTPVKLLLSVLNAANGAGGLLIKNICLNSYFNNDDFLKENINRDEKQWPFGIRRLLLNSYIGYWCGSSLPLSDSNTKFLIKSKDQPFPKVGTGPNFAVQCEAFSNYSDGLNVWNSYTYYVNNSISTTSGTEFPELQECARAVCVINGVGVNGSGNTGQPFNFKQQCAGCAKETTDACFCYIMDPDSLRKLNLGNPVLFKQSCPNAQCYKVESDGEIIPQDCTVQPSNSGKPDPNSFSDGGGDSKTIGENFEYGVDIWYFPIYIFSFAVIIIFLLWVMENRAHKLFKVTKTNTEGGSLAEKIRRTRKETKDKNEGKKKFNPISKLSKLFDFV